MIVTLSIEDFKRPEFIRVERNDFHKYKSNNWLKLHGKPMRRKPFKKLRQPILIIDEAWMMFKAEQGNTSYTTLMGLGSRSRTKEFVCTECGIICYSFSELKHHIKISHDIDLVEYDSVGKEYKTFDLGEAEILEEERKVNK